MQPGVGGVAAVPHGGIGAEHQHRLRRRRGRERTGRGGRRERLGGGRTAAGPIGTDVGYALHRIAGGLPCRPLAVTLTPLGAGPTPPRFTQTRRIEGEAGKLSPVVAAADLPHLRPLDPVLKPDTLLPPADSWEPSWAMVIDADACIGCNACVVACQAENNVPVVGPVEVARGRDMHWLRIDAYDVGEHPAQPRPAFQPVPCMQCEHAPCEPVCPVEASIHDHEGLNGQVYNRCIGTRFCESNCPYQVRRFNFHGYADGEAYADMGAPTYAGQKNPDVTVRGRGVMEKCTYCVQRISGARRAAEKEDRPIAPGEVTTACQDSCPTRAIRFDDLTRPGSVTAAARADPRHYALLGELGTRPRTTYLARLRNPNPALEGIA
ncbi:MAG: 4Fe-4S dicluster domain-containing protein [Caulobacteraceae bacterium]|nr:4Fe-4S dicluster domain-containing protein [Caulobacter sp.]